VRLEPIGAERARALLDGEPQLTWEEGFPLQPLLASLRRAIDEPDGPVRFGPFFAYMIVRCSDGLASESVALLTEWALAQPGVAAVCARVEPGNAASVRVLERFGFIADGQSGDHLRYVRSRTRKVGG